MPPSPLPEPGRVLVVRLKAIGDLLLSTAFLRALRKAHPRAQIHLLTTPACEPIVRHNPRVDRVLLHPGPGLARTLGLFRELRSTRYDRVFDLGATPRSAWITLATGAPVRVGFDFRVRKWAFTHPVPRNRVRKYQALVVLDLLRHLGIPDDGEDTEVFVGPGEKAWAKGFFTAFAGESGPRIALNPTGSWTSKQWPVERWRETAVRIHEGLGVKPFLFGGPADAPLLEAVAKGLEGKVRTIPKTSLLEAAAFIEGIDLLIGTDGTPQHLAQALGTPSLTILGPVWGLGWMRPSDPRHRHLQCFLDCGPCDRTLCPYPEAGGQASHTYRECMTRWTPEQVLRAARTLLEENGKIPVSKGA